MKKAFVRIGLLMFFFLGVFSCKNETQKVKVTEPVKVVINNSKDLVAAAKKEIVQITPEQLKPQLKKEGVYIIDVREKSEFDAGSIPGSILIPRGLLEFRIGSNGFWEDNHIKMPAKDQKIIIYCRSGGRGSLATKSLQQMGYTNVENLDGGFMGWEKQYAQDITHSEAK